MKPQRKDCICFASDASYLPHFATALASIADKSPQYDIFLFGEKLPENQHVKIMQFAEKLHLNLSVVYVDDTKLGAFDETDRITRATWIRVLIPQLISSEYQRMLYLDCDVVVVEPLDSLFNTEMGDFAVAAVLNGYSKVNDSEKLRLDMPKEAPYFNTGVLLIDLARWQKRDYSDSILDYAKNNTDKLKFADQSAINFICRNDILSISETYNYGIDENADTIVIIHLYLVKPWLFKDAPGFEYYEHYRNKTPYPFVHPQAKICTEPVLVNLGLMKYRLLRIIQSGKNKKKISKIEKNINKLEKLRLETIRIKKSQKRMREFFSVNH